MRHGSSIVNDIIPGQLLQKGDEVVLSGRREFAIGEEDWIGEEIVDPQLLDFPVEVLPVMIHKNAIFQPKNWTSYAVKALCMESVYAVSNGQVLISLFRTNHYRLWRYSGIGRSEKTRWNLLQKN